MEIVYSHQKVRDFVGALNKENLVLVDKVLCMLEAQGHELRMPYSKSIGKGLFELRIISNPQIRIIFGYYNNNAVLVHIFFKKTWKIPKKEIRYARKVWKMVVA